MTISELTLKSSDPEPARRFEVFTGSGRRREWLPEEKARIVSVLNNGRNRAAAHWVRSCTRKRY